MTWQVIEADCIEAMAAMDECSVDAIVTDPPAGISFMGKTWDSDHGGREGWVLAFSAVFAECLRVLKPGGHAVVWALPRTSHWTAWALEEAGFQIRDCVYHLFGSGFPKSLDVSKAIDKAAGAEREVVGSKLGQPGYSLAKGRASTVNFGPQTGDPEREAEVTAPATPDAQRWQGWGTALKPAAECWWLARKPLIGTVASNVQRFGTGALNIDGTRIGTEGGRRGVIEESVEASGVFAANQGHIGGPIPSPEVDGLGRWPANVISGYRYVLRLTFDADEVEPLTAGGDPGGARAGERVEHHAARRGYEPHQPAHQLDGLHRGMAVAVEGPQLPLGTVSLRHVIEPRGSTPVVVSRRVPAVETMKLRHAEWGLSIARRPALIHRLLVVQLPRLLVEQDGGFLVEDRIRGDSPLFNVQTEVQATEERER